MTSPPAAVVEARARTLSQSSDGSGGQYGAAARRRASSFGSFTRVVVVAIDVSDHSRHAFEWYLNNAWKNDDLIILVHCPEAPKLPTFSFKSGLAPPVDEWKKILDEMNAKARKLEEDYEGTCAIKKLKYKVRTEAMKNIGEGVLRIAEEETADAIVCGSKIMSGKYSSKGYTCNFIIQNSTIPVIVVPTTY